MGKFCTKSWRKFLSLTLAIIMMITILPAGIFADTENGEWYNKFINAAYNQGILEEKAGENFRPNDPITRK